MKSKRAPQTQEPEPTTRFLSPRNLQDLRPKVQQVQLAIARRAYELFEARDCEHGHDWEDWFRAESELLRAVSVSISESEGRISVLADVHGVEENELKVSIEPRRVTILGDKAMSTTETKRKNISLIDRYPNQILQLIDLSAEVIPESSEVKLQVGLLKFDLPKAAKPKIDTATPAA